MTRDEILAVTESDPKGCEAINKAVHEKLGLCWHEIKGVGREIYTYTECVKCKLRTPPFNPDYTHNISDAWAIKEWLDKHDKHTAGRYDLELDIVTSQDDWYAWASPLDRCKAFLLMDSDVSEKNMDVKDKVRFWESIPFRAQTLQQVIINLLIASIPQTIVSLVCKYAFHVSWNFAVIWGLCSLIYLFVLVLTAYLLLARFVKSHQRRLMGKLAQFITGTLIVVVLVITVVSVLLSKTEWYNFLSIALITLGIMLALVGLLTNITRNNDGS